MEKEQHQRETERATPETFGPLSKIKPFTLGILFFFFSLTLFSLASPNLVTKVTAIVAFALSLFFLVVILVNSLSFGRLSSFSKFLTNSRVRYAIQIGWIVLWEIAFVAYLLSHLLSLGNGLAKMEPNMVGHS
jgi:signal transduction histidine kinase